MKKTMSNFLFGFLAGAAAGAIAGILLAPEKGSTTRQNLKKKVKDLSDEYGLGLNEIIDELGLDTVAEHAAGPKKRKTSHKPRASSRKPQD